MCVINHFRCQTHGAQLGCVQHMQTFFQVSDNAGLLCNSFLMCIYIWSIYIYTKAVFMCDSVHMKYCYWDFIYVTIQIHIAIVNPVCSSFRWIGSQNPFCPRDRTTGRHQNKNRNVVLECCLDFVWNLGKKVFASVVNDAWHILPWYNPTGWLGIKHQLIYLLTCSPEASNKGAAVCIRPAVT